MNSVKPLGLRASNIFNKMVMVSPRSCARLFGLFVLIVGIAGCGTFGGDDDDVSDNWPEDKLYFAAKQELDEEELEAIKRSVGTN